jgi:hypothetical protein
LRRAMGSLLSSHCAQTTHEIQDSPPAIMPSHQPYGSPSLSQYFPITYEPT